MVGVTGTTVSSLGLERITFVLQDGTWKAVAGPAPRLVAVVRALERRRRAIEVGEIPQAAGLDLAAAERIRAMRHRKLTVDAWFIRSERTTVEVAEDSRLEGTLPDQPVDERRSRRLSLNEDQSGEFLFPQGLL
jgi:hypothetical protein